VSSTATKRQKARLNDRPFVSLMLDADKIGLMKVSTANLVSSNISPYFTYSITQIDRMDHEILRNLLEAIFSSLHDRNIQVITIISAGLSYQTKALNFIDHKSIQSRNPENYLFSRLTYVSCLCHPLNDAYHRLSRDSLVLNNVIKSLHDLARFCCKPKQRRLIGAISPKVTETR
jgi:hypothetical protein